MISALYSSYASLIIINRTYLNRIMVDSLVHDEETLEFLIKKMGIDNIMLGSDYPFPLGELHPGKMIEEARWLTNEEKTKLLSGNAIRFLGLDHLLDTKMSE